jgi:uncharacterized protein
MATDRSDQPASDARPRRDQPASEAHTVAGGPLRVLISGASGMIGTELVSQLHAAGHDVLRLVRRQPRAPDEHNWAPSAGMLDTAVLDGVDAVVNLSGASLGRLPWTRAYRREILASRLQATRTLAEAMGAAARPPAVFLSASAVGVYGDRPGERLDESSAHGTGFLAETVEAWEEAARLKPPQTRLVLLRSGLVLGAGGALAPLVTLTRLGLGARIGTGGDVWPWISLHDEAAAIRHLLGSGLAGPVNLVGPEPVISDRITGYLAARLHRPYALTLPPWLITAALQDAGRQLLLNSQKILPGKLVADGFAFRHRTAAAAIDAMLGGQRPRSSAMARRID